MTSGAGQSQANGSLPVTLRGLGRDSVSVLGISDGNIFRRAVGDKNLEPSVDAQTLSHMASGSELELC